MAVAADAARLVVEPLLAAVFPSRCPACAGLVERPLAGPLCDRCWRGLPRHHGASCRCGVPLPGPRAAACGRCRRGLTPFDAGASLGPYDGALRSLIHELKYRGRLRVADRLAEVLLTQPNVLALLTPDAVLVPVPLHPRRRRERGFNQAERLARQLAARTGHRVVETALVRRRDTPSQAGLSATNRRRNVMGAFVVRRRGRIAGRPVVLVDDVMTTGATVRACAEALRAAGAIQVRVLTLARVA